MNPPQIRVQWGRAADGVTLWGRTFVGEDAGFIQAQSIEELHDKMQESFSVLGVEVKMASFPPDSVTFVSEGL